MRILFVAAVFILCQDVNASPTEIVRVNAPVNVEVVEPAAEIANDVVIVDPSPTVVVPEDTSVVVPDETTTVAIPPEETTVDVPADETTVLVPSILINSTDVRTGEQHVTYVDEDGVVRWGGCGYKGLC